MNILTVSAGDVTEPQAAITARTRRPKSLIVLLVFFCWTEARALGAIVFPSMSGTYHFYETIGQLWVHYASALGTVMIAGTAGAYLWRPRRGWPEVTLAALGALAVDAIVGGWYSVRHLDVARSSYASGRVARGAPVSAERLDMAFTPDALWTATLTIVASLALLGVLAWRRRHYEGADAVAPADER